MSSLRQIAELTRRRMAKGNIPNDFWLKEEEVILMVPKIRDYLVDQSIKENYRLYGNYEVDPRFLTPYEDVDVQYNESRDKYYSVIPVPFVQLARGCGLYYVGPMKDESKKYVPVPPNFLSLSDGLECTNLGGRIGYWIEKDRVYYTKPLTDSEYKEFKVLIKLVRSLDNVDDDEDIFIPQELEYVIIETLIKFYTGEIQVLKDRINDNTPQ